MLEAESVSAGLDYPGVGPEHAHLADMGRARYEPVTDAEVLAAFELLARTEGIIPALESAHALAWVSRERAALAGKVVLVNLSGAGRQGRGPGGRAPRRRPVGTPRGPDDGAPTAAPARSAAGVRLRASRDAGRKLLVPYVTGGLPGWERTVEACAAAGRRRHRGRHPVLRPGDGRPHDPGGVRAGAGRGATPQGIVGASGDLDTGGVPLVVMTYYNTVHRYGHERFAGLAGRGRGGGRHRPRPAAGGGRGVGATRPTPPGSRRSCWPRPPASDERLARICARSRGWVYGVGLLGVTGERAALARSALEIAGRLKAMTDKPVLVGVGVSTPSRPPRWRPWPTG